MVISTEEKKQSRDLGWYDWCPYKRKLRHRLRETVDMSAQRHDHGNTG